ncbi:MULTISPECIES: flavin reductase family protein [Cupriavidus]|uniref:Flavin reductase-like, FMN-binding protein n=1 Tax=Cupriavidus pinatubonensis (strain JMP 134 / LMG 1197) TaxID=264198 RepID=Q46VK2_CUPPJ|nr:MULTISPECIES: flavin reductase family protein [Cupriavidus]QYY29384.1 flavin reductase family protein [Cupriavidus pinatubonensis]TPQ44076.1 flavin reductase [Cupriavidus pinatubonensis]
MTDARGFRNALGRFATGVAIVTTRTADGEPWGVTVNSFSSVSLEPRLVLWSLAKKSYSLEAFRKSGSFVIHVLASDQEDVSNRFARGTDGKFAGISCTDGIGGAPVLPGCAAVFQCRNAQQYDGGDHIIFIGEVHHFDTSDRESLLFYQGSYTRAANSLTDLAERIRSEQVAAA